MDIANRPLQLLGVVASLLLAACTGSGPRSPEPAAGEAASVPPAMSPDWRTWWLPLDDGGLLAAVDRALLDNLVQQQAVQRLYAARGLRDRTSDRFKPQVHAATSEIEVPQLRTTYFTFGLDASWELGLFGQREGRRNISQGLLEEAEADWNLAGVSLVGEVVVDWLKLGAIQQHRRLQAAQVAVRDRLLRLQTVRQDSGLGSVTTVIEARSALLQAQAQEQQLLAQSQTLQQQLALLLGLAQWPAELALPSGVEAGRIAGLQTVSADVLRRRPEVKLAQARVLQAAGDLRIAQAQLRPNVAIGGSIQWPLLRAGGGRAPSGTISSLGPHIDIPLFDWGWRQSQANARGHLLEAAVLGYRQAVLQSAGEVQQALGQLRLQLDELQMAEQVALGLQDHLQRLETADRAGVLDPLRLLDHQSQLLEAKARALDARVAAGLAYVALYKAVGGAPLVEMAGR